MDTAPLEKKEVLRCDQLTPDDESGIQKTLLNHLLSFQGRDPERAGNEDLYMALAYTMRDVLVKKMDTYTKRILRQTAETGILSVHGVSHRSILGK